MKINEALEHSFRNLALTTSYEQITIKAICESANVARTVFYSYYTDKADLLHKIVDKDLVEPILLMNELLPLRKIKSAQQLLLERVFQNVLAHKAFYKQIHATGTPTLARSITRGFEVVNRHLLTDIELSPIEKDYMGYSAAGAMAVLISKWIQNNYDLTPSQLAQMYRKLIASYWFSLAPEATLPQISPA